MLFSCCFFLAHFVHDSKLLDSLFTSSIVWVAYSRTQKNNFLLSSISWLRKENQIAKKQKKYIQIRFCNKWFLNISWKKRKQGSNWTLTLAKAVALKVTREMKRENPCAGACNCMRNEMCCVLRKWRETGRTGQNVQAV